ncbi:polysaccharide pyruvyl transferase family protein [Microbacterium sp. 4R-513]|uniref:polysaccharide pyruvyl transferase family protein n=1 Tax=Microbacterium sp. 4R-513 TaxID=2567934 RepID=UPI0013E19564|nr:polysaccharide pyruvyl transferase family protein [Microbacterium sp. 4R-513]QIG38542.1 polysaccharide pyruvyl transferase family protein [Microbacterium sp. 4R-513]
MRILASAVGQYDNVGDTVLRRGFLDHLRTIAPLRVYIGDKTDDYVSGLGLQPGDIPVRDSREWRSEVSKELLSGGFYAFDTGETEVERAFAKRYLKLAPLLAVNRLRGGTAVQLGVGVRASTPWRRPIGTVLRMCDMVSWRDEKSRDMMGFGAVTPDWAFALGSPDDFLRDPDHPRPRLAIAFRQGLSHMARDKPSDEWVATVRRTADRLGLEPIVVAQIERDGPLAIELADRLGCEALPWLDDNHARQEERLRAAYRESALVLSDRLHAVVIAATEGAVPIALQTGPMDKVTRTLEGAGIRRTSVPRELPDEAAVQVTLDDALARRPEIMEAVVAARTELGRVTDQLRAKVRAKGKIA